MIDDNQNNNLNNSNSNQENNNPYNFDNNMNNGFYQDMQNNQNVNQFWNGNSNIYPNQNSNVMPGFENTNNNQENNVMPGFENANNNQENNVMPGFENTNNNQENNVMPGFENANNNQENNVMPGFENANNNQENNVMPGFENTSNNQGNNVMPGFENVSDNQNDEDFNYQQNINNSQIPTNEPLPQMQDYANGNFQNNGQSVYSDQGFDNSNVGDQQSYNEQQFNMFSENSQMQNPNMGYDNQMQNPNMGYDNQMQNSNMGYDNQMQNLNMGYDNQMQNPNMDYNGQFQTQNSYVGQDINNGQYNGNAGNSSNANSQNSGDYNLEFVKAWMGSLYEKAHSKKFNFAAAFFNGMYFCYRKMNIIGIIILILQVIVAKLCIMLNNTTSVIIAIIYMFLMFIISGFGFYPAYRSFVKGKLGKYKTQTTNNNELINIANQKGGTSILGLIIYIVIISLATVLLNFSSFNFSVSKPSSNTISNNTQNETTEPVEQLSEYIIDNEYEIEYNSLDWLYNKNTDSLIQGAYTLKYTTKYEDTKLNVDFSSDTQRASTLQMFVTSFTKQASTQNMQVDSPNSTFIAKNFGYYAYVDVIGTTDISRYYFVILPEEHLMFQFVLTVSDTSIESNANIEIIDMITKIKKRATSTVNTNGNLINENVLLDVNTTSENNINEINDTTRNVLSSGNEVREKNKTEASNILGTNN